VVSTLEDVVQAIEALRRERSRIVVGVSGFGGSGKSTLARFLVSTVPGSARIRGDDFLEPDRSHRRSSEWDGVERRRIRREVLDPFREGRASEFRRFEWEIGELGAPEPLPAAEVLVVDAIGLFHPELHGAIDLRIWVDVDLETATARGKERDRAAGHDHDHLWDDVWVPNERDFMTAFDPRGAADMRYQPTDAAAGVDALDRG
jgi:uridine kinase